MRFRVCQISDVFGGTSRVLSLVAASILLVGLTAALCTAGDLSPQPADSLNVTNSATKLLPQTQATEQS